METNIEHTVDNTPVICDICGKNMRDTQTSAASIGFMLSVNSSHFEYTEFLNLFGKSELKMCFCCFAEKLGFEKATN